MRNAGSVAKTGSRMVVLGAKSFMAVVFAAALAGSPAVAQKAPAKAKAAKSKGATASKKNSGWVKLCRNIKIPEQVKGKKAKIIEAEVCRTFKENMRFDIVKSGRIVLVPIYTASIAKVIGKNIHTISIVVPDGVALQMGVSIAILNKAQWLQLKDTKKADLTKAPKKRLPYLECRRGTCTAELTITPKFINALKKGAFLLAEAVVPARGPVTFIIPLLGFTATYDGPAIKIADFQKKRQILLQNGFADAKAKRDAQASIAAQNKAAQSNAAAVTKAAPKKK